MRQWTIDRKRPDPVALDNAARILDGGGVVIFPTDTQYGLLGRVDHPDALERIKAVKEQGDDKPMPCLAANVEMALESYFPATPLLARLAKRLWPGPVTLIGPAQPALIGAATGDSAAIGIRVPDSRAVAELCLRCGSLLAATSANPHGKMPAINASMMKAYFGGVDDLTFFDAGELDSRGSTIVDLSVEPPNLLRRGELPREAIEAALGRPVAEVILKTGEVMQELAWGPLRIIQPRKGFRYSVDALLLAAFVNAAPDERVADIGCGSGVVPLLLAGRGVLSVTGIELQEATADMARRSVLANALGDRIAVVGGDVRRHRELWESASFDVVCANPPYHAVDSGFSSPDPARAASRHELTLTLAQTVEAARYLLRDNGRFYMIHLAQRRDEILAVLRNAGFASIWWRNVRTKTGAEPKFLLIECVAAAAEGHERPLERAELLLHGPDGAYTEEARAFLDRLAPRTFLRA